MPFNFQKSYQNFDYKSALEKFIRERSQTTVDNMNYDNSYDNLLPEYHLFSGATSLSYNPSLADFVRNNMSCQQIADQFDTTLKSMGLTGHKVDFFEPYSICCIRVIPGENSE